MNLQSFLMLLLLVLLGGCHNHSAATKKMAPLPKEKITETESEGVAYTDAQIQAMLEEHAEKTRPIVMDSFVDLHQFDHSKFSSKFPKILDLQTIESLDTINRPLTPAQKQLLNATDYLWDISFRASHKAFIFFNQNIESHYGKSIVLKLIPQQSNKVVSLVLSQFYGSENYERIISTTLIQPPIIQREIKEYLGPRNDGGFMDNKSKQIITKETYKILTIGDLDLTHSDSISIN